MQVEPRIKFHDVPHSEWVIRYIRDRLQRLDRYAGGITSCQVTLAREQSKHNKGNRYSVLVEVRVPPQHDLAAKKQLDIKDMNVQLPALITQSFSAIERQLKKIASLRRGEAKNHATSSPKPHGIVEKLFPDGYGFIRAVDDDRQYYFHRNSVLHGDYERLAIGTEVRFFPEDGDKGPQASSVQIVGRPDGH